MINPILIHGMVWLLVLFELASSIIGFAMYHKLRNQYWRLLPFFLLFVFITEAVATALSHYPGFKQTIVCIYRYANIPACILFYHWLFWKYFENEKIARWVTISVAFFLLSFCVEEFLLPEGYKKYGSLSYQVGVIGLLVLSFQYFKRLVRSDDLLKCREELMFWLVSGFVLYHLTTLPFNAMRNSLWIAHKPLFMVYWYVSFLFNYLMYAFYAIGFLCYKLKQSYL